METVLSYVLHTPQASGLFSLLFACSGSVHETLFGLGCFLHNRLCKCGDNNNSNSNSTNTNIDDNNNNDSKKKKIITTMIITGFQAHMPRVVLPLPSGEKTDVARDETRRDEARDTYGKNSRARAREIR